MSSQAPLAGMESGDIGPVTCLGLSFENDAARRDHFAAILRRRLRDPEFRATPGFPKGTDDDILAMSDPPYYTACPNPFLADFVRHHGRPYDPTVDYHREPFAVDVSVGKGDALYKAHGYHTKVPHLAIVPTILHYTRPGDLVLDGFCGSGMTGVAAQYCGSAPPEYRRELEARWRAEGRPMPEWGARRAILNDLSPAATFIAAGYNLPFDVPAFAREARRILDEVDAELGWMYETLHTDGVTKGRINYTVWSEIFTCPNCTAEVNFVAEALDSVTKRVHDLFPCPHCGVELTKDNLERLFDFDVDPATGQSWRHIRLRPVLIEYSVGPERYEKSPDATDHAILERIKQLPLPPEVPSNAFPIAQMYHGSRLAPKGFTHIHHLFLPRPAQSLAALWRKANAVEDVRLRGMLVFWAEQAIWTSSILNRYRPTGYSQVGQYLTGVYYVPSQHAEVSPHYVLDGKALRMASGFDRHLAIAEATTTNTGDCARCPILDDTIDYIFTDPPFGENIYYADLNFLVESWHRVITDAAPEAIVDETKHKDAQDYQDLMRRCFAEYFRVLKPGRWMTVVFSNSSNAIWRAIQEAMGTAGFVVADLRTLDKQQGSYRQVTSSAVKQDLVISAYKPTAALDVRFELDIVDEAAAWAFVREHLGNVPVFVGQGQKGEVLAERTPQLLHDRMVAFFVQRGEALPIAGPDFLTGLAKRFPERDGMYFLPDQVAEYDRRRTAAEGLVQLDFLVSDEATAIRWLRGQLTGHPQRFQELQPRFMQESPSWSRYESTIDLREILKQNFLCYEGDGPVPPRIHAYLSSNYKDLRGLEKEDALLRAKARDRWYVPDPNQASDLLKLREQALLQEFNAYKTDKQRRLKLIRTEAVRAGFKAAYEAQDFASIVEIARRLPETVLADDENLYMYVDVARTQLRS